MLKLCYCLSQILIFVGWYSDPKSILSQWLCPFIKNELEFELKLKSEIEDENNQDQLEGENDAREKDQIEEKIDSGAGIKEE